MFFSMNVIVSTCIEPGKFDNHSLKEGNFECRCDQWTRLEYTYTAKGNTISTAFLHFIGGQFNDFAFGSEFMRKWYY